MTKRLRAPGARLRQAATLLAAALLAAPGAGAELDAPALLAKGVEQVEAWDIEGAAAVVDELVSRFPSSPETAFLRDAGALGDAPQLAQINTTEQTAVLPRGLAEAPKRSLDKRLLAVPFLLAIVLGGFFGYRYFKSTNTEQINSIASRCFPNRLRYSVRIAIGSTYRRSFDSRSSNISGTA